jgi:hypothetical protein
MPITVDLWDLIGTGVGVVGTFLGGLWLLLRMHAQSVAGRLTEHMDDESRRDEAARSAHHGLDQRVEQMEHQVAQMPTRGVMHAISLGIERLAGQVGVMAVRIEAVDKVTDKVEATTARWERFLIERA